jgi:predicted transcriptional regulator
MTTLQVAISDDRLLKLKEIAARLKVTPEELVRVSIEDLVAQPAESFRQASEYVLKKNSELYRRLA